MSKKPLYLLAWGNIIDWSPTLESVRDIFLTGLGNLLEEKYVWLGLVDFIMFPAKTLLYWSVIRFFPQKGIAFCPLYSANKGIRGIKPE